MITVFQPSRSLLSSQPFQSRIKFLFIILQLMVVLPSVADNWMKRLPDNTYVSVLSIPGSHDSATGHGFTNSLFGSFGNEFAKTQELTIEQQWEAGIRAFDFRPALYEDYINANHGLVPTKLRFNNALYMLRDLLIKNPSEFVIIHLLHASEGDDVNDSYEERLLELLNSPDLRDFFADFKKDLRVKDLRGKILLLSRDQYAKTPIGGFFKNWTGSAEWNDQIKGQISGSGSNMAKLYMQDYSDTHNDGGIDTKIAAMTRLLKASTTHKTSSQTSIVWVINLTSAYSKVTSLFGQEISTSDGYRDNATYTHTAFLDFMASPDYIPGPTGIVLMDYAGVDWTNDYNTRGKEMVDNIIANNFLYLTDVTAISEADVKANAPEDMTPLIINPRFNANNLITGWGGDSFGAVGGKENAEHYNCTFNTYQTIYGLPNGVYAVGMKGFYRAGLAEEAYTHYKAGDGKSYLARLYAIGANDIVRQEPLLSPFSKVVARASGIGREASYTDGNVTYYIPDDMEAAEYYMHKLQAYNNKVMVVVDNHTLTIGVRKNETIDGDWAIFDDFTLTYYGNGDDAYQLWDNNVTTGLSEEIPHTVNMMQNTQAPSYYTLDGKSVKVPRQRGLYLQKDANGFVRKFLHDE